MAAPQRKPRLLPTQAVETQRFMRLADNLQIDVDSIIGQGIAGFGIPGSGKTNAAALLAEEFGKFYIPMVVFDLEGDYVSLVDVLPRALVATPANCPTGTDVLEKGLQVIYDLSSWPNDDMAASVIVSVINELMSYAGSLPHSERVPCLVFLDEASHWLPQGKGERMSEQSYKNLRDTFNLLSSRGRKYGLTPALFSQRISELSKSVLTPGVFIFMKQTMDVDINRYMAYITPPGDLKPAQLKSRIARLAPGKAFVRIPGVQKLVTFYKRKSEHVSHTPKSQAAMNKYAALPFNPDESYGAFVEMPEPEGEQTPDGPSPVVVVESLPTPKPAKVAKKVAKKVHQPTAKTIARKKVMLRRFLREHPDANPGQVAKELKISWETAKNWLKELNG